MASGGFEDVSLSLLLRERYKRQLNADTGKNINILIKKYKWNYTKVGFKQGECKVIYYNLRRYNCR
jgi:hypothetical protein